MSLYLALVIASLCRPTGIKLQCVIVMPDNNQKKKHKKTGLLCLLTCYHTVPPSMKERLSMALLLTNICC